MKKNSRMSSQPRKVRGRMYSAPLHVRQKMVAAHLSKEIRGQYKRRSLPVRTGDKVKIMRGEFKGTVGKVDEVDLSSLKAFVENITQTRTDGKKVKVAVDPSNMMIIELNLDDKMRKKMLMRSTSPSDRDRAREPRAPKPLAKVFPKTATVTTTTTKASPAKPAIAVIGGKN